MRPRNTPVPLASPLPALLAGLLLATALSASDAAPGDTAGASAENASPAASAAATKAAARSTFAVVPIEVEIEIDGVLDEPAWAQATRVPLTHEWYPSYNAEPPVATDCLVTFDHKNLYVGFRAFDPEPAKIRARLADRDIPFSDDTVGIVLDTFHDRRRAYEFRVNPLSVQMDGTVDDGRLLDEVSVWVRTDFDGDQDWSWDAIWNAQARIVEDGYVVEMAIPLNQIRFAPGEGEQTWGFLATRHYPRSLDHEIRSTELDRNRNCQVCQFDDLRGFRDLTTGRNLEITPTITASHTDVRDPFPAGPLRTADEEETVGLTVRWGITPTFTLNAAANPDFSQVEADAAQLDVNTRFTLFFPEKRPFFLERFDYFTTPIQAVFTRTIADPSAGLKLTGKRGRNEYGLFAAEDRLNNLVLPASEFSRSTSLDQDVRSTVFRYRRDVASTSSLGFLYTGREATGYHNNVFGVDGTLRIGESNNVTFQYLRSDTDYPDAIVQNFSQPDGSFTGSAWEVTWERSTENWFTWLYLTSLDDGFRADNGFVNQVGIRQGIGIVERHIWPQKEKSWFSRFVVHVDSIYTERQDGVRIDSGSNLELTWEGPSQLVVKFSLRPNDETFLGREFFNFRYDVFVSARPAGRLEFEFLGRQGEVIDFTNVRQAEFTFLRPTIDFRLGKRFTGILDLIYQTFSFRGERYLKAQLSQGTLIYHLNAKAFVRAILQYRKSERVPELYDVPVQPEDESLFSQFLFSYKLNPQSVLLAGYSDFSFGNQFVDLTRANRTFYLKIGYAWNR